MTLIKGIKIILVEPAGERNIGSIARVMRNMGLMGLVIVNPRCDYLSQSAQIMAVHGINVLKNATIVDSLSLALEGCEKAIATTSRTRGIPTYLETPREVLSDIVKDSNSNYGIIFGPEDRGLSNEELSYAQRFVSIPSNEEYPSLNLAQAVGICAYEIYQGFIDSQDERMANRRKNNNDDDKQKKEKNLATIDELTRYYEHLESILLQVNYLYPHTADTTMRKIKRIINSIEIEKSDLAMLRGMLRQVEWGLKNKPTQEKLLHDEDKKV